MRLREEDEPLEGHETWRPRMGRGGRFVVWLVLAMIVAGSALMVWEAWRGLRVLL